MLSSICGHPHAVPDKIRCGFDIEVGLHHRRGIGHGVRCDGAAGDRHQVDAAIDRLDEGGRGHEGDLPGTGDQGRRQHGHQRQQHRLDGDAVFGEQAFLGGDEQRRTRSRGRQHRGDRLRHGGATGGTQTQRKRPK
jgi:hypothetical protein